MRRACRRDVSAKASPHQPDPDRRPGRPLARSEPAHDPPARERLDRKALIEALRDGTIDCVAADHAARAPRRKTSIEAAANGTTRLEARVPALYRVSVEPGLIDLWTLVARIDEAAQRAPSGTRARSHGEATGTWALDLGDRYVVGQISLRSRAKDNTSSVARSSGCAAAFTLAAGQVAYARSSRRMTAVALFLANGCESSSDERRRTSSTVGEAVPSRPALTGFQDRSAVELQGDCSARRR